MGVVVRRYIDFLILLIPTLVYISALFCSSSPTFCSFLQIKKAAPCLTKTLGHANKQIMESEPHRFKRHEVRETRSHDDHVLTFFYTEVEVRSVWTLKAEYQVELMKWPNGNAHPPAWYVGKL